MKRPNPVYEVAWRCGVAGIFVTSFLGRAPAPGSWSRPFYGIAQAVVGVAAFLMLAEVVRTWARVVVKARKVRELRREYES